MQKTAFSRRKTNIAFSNCVVDDGVMYFYASNIRALCKMDMGTKEASFESDIIINGERVDDVLMVSADGGPQEQCCMCGYWSCNGSCEKYTDSSCTSTFKGFSLSWSTEIRARHRLSICP